MSEYTLGTQEEIEPAECTGCIFYNEYPTEEVDHECLLHYKDIDYVGIGECEESNMLPALIHKLSVTPINAAALYSKYKKEVQNGKNTSNKDSKST